ncbi:MAG: radical SAM family heme chaperone HemW [Flavobacterium sp.]
MTLYIHIPFCKKACHYCDFHFSTTLTKKNEMVNAICLELILRKNEILEPIETIYLGGGTPSLLDQVELELIFKTIYSNYSVLENAEVTLEANPDDLTLDKIITLSKSKINRLSIGIQSFDDNDLLLMNRVHQSKDAIESLQNAQKYFKNISIDLIYGMPYSTLQDWQKNIEMALSFNIPHISCYALTVEPQTALEKMIETQKITPISDEIAHKQFMFLIEILEKNGFIHYEMSNFGKEGFFSQNNTAYWTGKKYLGIGPSAHSFDQIKRSWNIANNLLYIKKINDGILPQEFEILTQKDLYNEYLMTSLRTMKGISLAKISKDFGTEILNQLIKNAQKYLDLNLLIIENDFLKTTNKGKFLLDGIISDLFLLHLEPKK